MATHRTPRGLVARLFVLLTLAALAALPAAAQSLGMLLEQGLVPGLGGRLLLLEQGPLTGGEGVDLALLPAEQDRPGGLLLGSQWGDLLLYPQGAGGLYDPPQVWLGADPAQWQWPPVPRQVSPEVVDEDGDGQVDLLVGWGEQLLWYRRDQGRLQAGEPVLVTGGGALAEAVRRLDPRAGHLAPTVADVDGDGHPDLLLGADDGTVWWARNTAATGFALAAPQAMMCPTGPLQVGSRARPALGELTGDHRPDLLVGSGEGKLALYPGMPTGLGPGRELTFSAPPDPPLGGSVSPRLVESEVLLAEGTGFVRRVRYAPPGDLTDLGRLAGRNVPLDLGSAPAVSMADADGDGHPDLVAGEASGGVWVCRNLGGGEWRLEAPTPLRAGGEAVRAAGGYAWPLLVDVDGDRDLDLLLGTGLGQVELWLRSGDLIRGAPLAAGAGPIQAAGPATVALMDWEGRGKPDFLVGSRAQPALNVSNVQVPAGQIAYFANHATGRVSLPNFTKGTLLDCLWPVDAEGTQGALELGLSGLVPVPDPGRPTHFLGPGAGATYLFSTTTEPPLYPTLTLPGPAPTPGALLPALYSVWVTADVAGRPEQVLGGIGEYGMVCVFPATALGLR